MSWQTYVDTNLVAGGKVSRAAILGQAGGVWAASPGFTLLLEEQKAIRDSFANPDLAWANGIRLAENKFITTTVNPVSNKDDRVRSIYLRKGGNGAVLVKTTQAVLVAEYIAPTQAAEAAPVVEGLADYLISVGY